MRRDVGIPVAAGAIILIPFVVAFSATKPDSPPTTTASIAIHHTAEVFRANPGTFRLKIRVAGPAPAPTKNITRFADATGTDVATISVLAPKDCDGVKQYDTGGTSTQIWCLDVTGLKAGANVAGKLSNGNKKQPTELSLTIGSRHGWGLPLGVALGGLLVAMFLAFWPSKLREMVKRALLDSYRERNRNAGDDSIEHLDAWIDARLRKAKPSEVMPVVADLVKNAKTDATNARAALATTLESLDPPLPPAYAIVADAHAEIESTKLDVGDFVDDDGKPVPHPATKLAGALHVVDGYLKKVNELKAEITTLRPECRERLGSLPDAVASQLSQLTSIDAPSFAARINDLDNKVSELLDDPTCVQREFARPRLLQPVGGEPPEPPSPRTTKKVWVLKSVLDAGIATLVTFVLLFALAITTVMMATYQPTATFGSFADYFKVFAAAVGSSTAATMLAVLLYWSPDEPAA